MLKCFLNNKKTVRLYNAFNIIKSLNWPVKFHFQNSNISLANLHIPVVKEAVPHIKESKLLFDSPKQRKSIDDQSQLITPNTKD